MKKAESVFLEKCFDYRSGRGVLNNKYVPAYPFPPAYKILGDTTSWLQ
jgi:hypothetical protein